MNNYEKYKQQLDGYRQELENDNYEVEQDVIELENEIKDELPYADDDEKYLDLLKEIKNMKEEFDFYDEDAILNMMFPDRENDDYFE